MKQGDTSFSTGKNSNCEPGEPHPLAAGAQDYAVDFLGVTLRDFFMARGGSELAAALYGLGWKSARDPAQAMEAEYAFNRLFVGPDAVPAPPYSSIYLDDHPLLMGQSCLQIRRLAHDLGLSIEREGREPEDHIACELDLWLCLDSLEQRLGQMGHCPEEVREGVEAAQEWLLEHMNAWIPQFTSRAMATENLPESIKFVLTCLEEWLKRCNRRSHEQ